MENITLQDIIDCKKVTVSAYDNNLRKLDEFDADENVYKLCGNRIVYHHQFENLIRTPARHHKSFHEFMTDDSLRQQLIMETNKRCIPYGRKITPSIMYDVYRANKNCVTIFKASTAKYIYKYYGAKHVLDFTAGWGGRMLGAWSLGIEYTGIDTNINMKHGYDAMLMKLSCTHKYLTNGKLKMIWDNCLNVDLSVYDFDLVLTSPPYINLEKYEHMTPFDSDDMYYKEFLMIMLDRCLEHIKQQGWVCINISVAMYDKLTKKYGYRECDEKHILPNAKNKQNLTKCEYIYCWQHSVV